MRNQRAFTLAELLAVIVILGVIMLIAVPNIISVIDKNKKEIYVTDADKMKTMAEYTIRTNTNIVLPAQNEILVIPLSTINNGDLTTDPEGYNYSDTNSYVAIMKNDAGFDEYWVNLVGEQGDKNRGVYLSNLDELKSDTRYEKIVKNMTVPKGQDIAKVMCGSTNCKTVRTYVK